MKDISLRELLEAGCHFGHQVTRQNPKAREFIFQAREGIHIIDLVKTREGLLAGANFVRDVATKGGIIVFVGTKRQARTIVEEAVKKANGVDTQSRVFIVTERWIGGTLTNFEEVSKNYKKLKDLRARLQNEEEKAKYTKKEVGLWEKERVKLEKLYGGLSDITRLPDAVFIIDTHKEDLAVKEANRKEIPVVGIVDTNADPTVVDYPIAANDDAVGSIQLIVNYITDAWIEGSKLKVDEEDKVEKKEQSKEEVKEKPKAKKITKKPMQEKEEGGKRKPRTTKKTA